MRHVLISSLIAIGAVSTARAEILTFTGTLGASRIGMTIDVANPKTDGPLGPRSHYFYTAYLEDIPLSGQLSSESTFTEPSGGMFALHFTGNGSEHGQVLALFNSTGLSGTWTRAGKTLPVTLTSDWGGSAEAASYTDNVIGVADARDFERKVQAFRTAVLADDRSGALRFVHFPLRVNASGSSRSIESGTALLSSWDTVFTPDWRAALAQAVPHDMFVHRGAAMIGNGMAWFDGTGLVAVNPPRPAR